MGLHIFVRGFAGLTNEGVYKTSNSSAEFITIQARGRGEGFNQMHPCTWVYDAYKPQFMIIFIWHHYE